MQVIKKLGYRQPYDINKIKIALQETAKSIDTKFINSDWRELKPRIISRLEPTMKDREEIYCWEIDDIVIDTLLRSRFNDVAKEYIQSRSKVIRDKLNDLNLTPLAMWLLKERYLKRDENGSGEPIETAREMMCRVAAAIASVERNQRLRNEYTKKFSDMLCNLDFLPNSPALVSAGNNRRGTYSACFAYDVKDSLDSIFSVLKNTAKTFQMGGGVGISISNLREKGSLISTSNGCSSGPVEFLHLFNTMVETVKAGGFRRGALLSMMKYNHPDIEEFIHCKGDVNKLNNMNISVLVDDKFIDAVENEEDIELISPKDNKPVKSISATLILEMIATNIWRHAEPGILFYDRMNEDNPTPHLGVLDVVNPCSESNLRGCGESCNLGSINLTNHLEKEEIDWDKLANTTKLAVRFLDNMLDASPYPSRATEKAAKETRKIGLGIMGFGDMLIKLDIRYSSPEAIGMAGKIMAFINDVASQTSTELGKEKGLYNEYRDGYIKRRNSIVTTQAPTGSISLICGTSSGVEPNFAKEYTRLIDNRLVRVIHPLRDHECFEVANEIPMEQHLKILAEFQKHVENSISKCLAHGTNIQTNKGIIPIQDLTNIEFSPDDKEQFAEPLDNLMVKDLDGNWEHVTNFYYGGRKKTKVIRLDNGDVIEGTLNHKLMTSNGWKHLNELEPGDYIKCRKSLYSGNNNRIELPTPQEYSKKATTYNIVNIPKYMTEELSLFIGMIASDGYTSEGSGNVGITTANNEVDRLFRNLSKNIFDIDAKVIYDKRTKSTRNVFITSKKLVKWIESIMGKGCMDKYVPKSILRGSTKVQKGFLRGITLDGYKKVCNTRNELCIYEGYSKDLAKGIYSMCCSLGAAPYFGNKKVPIGRKSKISYGVFIDEDIIDAIELHKHFDIAEKVRLTDVPVESFKDLDYHKYPTYPKRSRTYNQLEYLVRKYRNGVRMAKTNTLNELNIKYDKSIYFSKVTSVRDSESLVYDIEVGSTNSYLVNNIISHNTIGAPTDTTVREIKELILQAHKLRVKGVTIYRDGCEREPLIKCEDCKV